jgi:hypothetical protein
MSAKIIAIILAVVVIGSSIGMLINLQNMFDLGSQDPLETLQQLIDLPTRKTTPAPTPTHVPAVPTLPPDDSFDKTFTPTPSPTTTPTNSNNSTINSRSCYKVTINGKVFEECSENGDLNFHYED